MDYIVNDFARYPEGRRLPSRSRYPEMSKCQSYFRRGNTRVRYRIKYNIHTAAPDIACTNES